MAKNRKFWWELLFAAYSFLMLWLLYGQRWGQNAGSLNLRPFDTLRCFVWVIQNRTDAESLRHAVVNLAGNVIMFVPLGFLVPGIWQKMQKFGWHFLAMVLSIVLIELLQLVTNLGSCDVDDLMLNLVGTTIGFLLWKAVSYIRKKRK